MVRTTPSHALRRRHRAEQRSSHSWLGLKLRTKRFPLQYSKSTLDQVDAEAPLGCCGGESAEDSCVGWIRSATVGNNPACFSAWYPSDNHRDPDTRRLAIGCEREISREYRISSLTTISRVPWPSHYNGYRKQNNTHHRSRWLHRPTPHGSSPRQTP